MKALVIGSTGLVGHELIELLLADDRYEGVISLHRRPIGLVHNKLREEVVDFERPEEWKHLVNGDVLFSAMGTTLKKAGSKEAQYKVDHTFQYHVAKAAAGNGVPVYVLVSAAMASVRSPVFYSRMKGELERDVQSLPFRHMHILRPGILTGPRNEKRMAEEWSAALMKGIGRIPGLRHLHPITGRQMARAMVWLSQHSTEPFEIHKSNALFDAAHKNVNRQPA
jgi:uncharacterized protein YbjT (DUF2867 family)